VSLNAGARIGAYEVLFAIGAGGMGEVYRATDTKLNREVALKILPAELALDADRHARFTREAQLLASLNHPNIAAIRIGTPRALFHTTVAMDPLLDQYAVSADGQRFLVNVPFDSPEQTSINVILNWPAMLTKQAAQ
jgi:serine/threonine protein kinase